jgi:hypothetical protein
MGFVDEQDAVECLRDPLAGLQRRLSGVSRDQAGAVGLDQMAAFEYAEIAQDLAIQPRHDRLAGPRRTGEDHVQR